jgi:drug/metabolite transporter (DMT)-like permease
VSQRPGNLRAAGLLALTMLLFAGSDTILKLVLARLPLGEVAFLRNVVVCIAVLAFLGLRHRLPSPRACLERTTLARGCVELGTAVTFFLGLRSLPLATAVTLVFASPLMSIALAVLVLRERVDWQRWTAAILGFLGVLLIVRPAPSSFEPAAFWPLLTAFLVSLRDLLTRLVPPQVNTGAITLTAAAAVALGGLATLPFAWVTPSASELGLLLIGGLLISVAYATVVIAFRIGDMSFIAPFRYVSIPLSALLGWLVFGDRPTWHLLAGAVVIVASGVYIFRRERRLARSAVAAG